MTRYTRHAGVTSGFAQLLLITRQGHSLGHPARCHGGFAAVPRDAANGPPPAEAGEVSLDDRPLLTYRTLELGVGRNVRALLFRGRA